MSNSKLFGMLRAMDAYERRNAVEPVVTCHLCGAPVEADALDVQTGADGTPQLTAWYCRARLIAGTKRLVAAIQCEGGVR